VAHQDHQLARSGRQPWDLLPGSSPDGRAGARHRLGDTMLIRPVVKRLALLGSITLTAGIVFVVVHPATVGATPAVIAKGDLAVSLLSGEVDEYTPSGTFVQELISGADGLSTPTGSAFDGNGNLYVTDFSNDQILERDALTGAVSTFASNATLANGHSFNAPESIVFSKGYSQMFVSNANREGAGGGINIVDTATGKGAGFYPLPSSNGSEGAGESDWLAFDANSTLYMTNESPSQGVMKVDTGTGDIVQPSFVADLPNYGYAISFDKDGNLWVGDTDNILEFRTDGTAARTISNPDFSQIFSAVFNATGDRLYAGDLATGSIYTYDLSGNLVGNFNAGSGVSGLSVAGAAIPPNTGTGSTAVDTVVNNSDRTLADTAGDGGAEPSIAVNPSNPSKIAIVANSGMNADRWGPGRPNAPIYFSTNGGQSWTKKAAIPAPPLRDLEGCPCDATVAYGRDGTLYFSVLSEQESEFSQITREKGHRDVYTATNSGDPTKPSDWHWRTSWFRAQQTNAQPNNADQPWLEVTRDVKNKGQDNAYVAYDDFSFNQANDPVDDVSLQVAASFGSEPPNFTQDATSGSAVLVANPAHRIAGDPSTGKLFELHQNSIPRRDGKVVISYRLNLSADDGKSWKLNGKPNGLEVANVVVNPGTPLADSPFDSLNHTPGMLALAVDPRDGSAYVIYGLDTSGSGYRDGLAVRHITLSGTTAVVGPQHVIAQGVSTQLPAAAVNSAGRLAVLFDEYRNPSQAHSIDVVAAVSADGGATFNHSAVSTFTLTGSHPTPDGRPLGDYQQLRAVGATFYGAFAAARNGFDKASPLADRIDPAFISFSG
jgi:sugar lactone lactonase YvrE